MAARIPYKGDAVGTGAGAGANTERGPQFATASEATVVPAIIQEVSGIKKNSGPTDWNRRAAGACEDASRS